MLVGQMSHRRGQRQRGYSLAELLVVITIIGMISLVTVPNFISYMRSGRIKSSLRQFNGDLRGIRQRSITRYTTTKLSFTTGAAGARTYALWEGTLNPQTGVITWDAAPLQTRQLEDGVYFPSGGTNFADENADGTFDVIFRSNGTVVNVPGGSTYGYVRMRTDWNITKPQYEIRVNVTGRLEVL